MLLNSESYEFFLMKTREKEKEYFAKAELCGKQMERVTEEVEEGGSKFDMFKNFLKQLMPQNTDLIPVMEANAGGATIIDNSVKSVNQNNANQNISLESRNNDSSYHIANRYKDA